MGKGARCGDVCELVRWLHSQSSGTARCRLVAARTLSGTIFKTVSYQMSSIACGLV